MLIISKLHASSPIDFAAEELKKYLRMMMPEGGDVKIAYNPKAKDGFRLGLMQDFALDVSDADDACLDDIIYIDCDEVGGIIAGSNPRSVLLAVYEYLRQMGCRWLFPGVDGEYIPMKDITPVKYRHKADARIRGNCIEGAGSQKVFIDFIDFLPKVGLNTFMIQFRVPKTFYDRYYNHQNNLVTYEPEPITDTQVVQWTAEIECEMAKRSLLLHYYGHGFTTDPFGIDSSLGWRIVEESEYPKDVLDNFAMLNGKRGFFGGKPLNTQLCLSNEAVRRKVVDYVVKYSERHSNIDSLHFWLADSSNNHCECDECLKARPTDFYIRLMNEIDDALTKAGNDMRLVFIVYVDTFWAPVFEKVKNPARFTLMMAPIARDYAKSYDESLPKLTPPPYVRNKLTMPKTLEESISLFNEWKRAFTGDNFVFEYHFWKPQHYDLSGRELAKRIYEDIRAYRKLGFGGVMECGSQRSFFPNGFAFYTHARGLFDASLSLSDIEKDYYCHAYGEDYEKFASALQKLNDAFPYVYISPPHAMARPELYATKDAGQRVAAARKAKEEIERLVTEYYNSDVRVRTVSVRLLECLAVYLDKFIDIIENKANGDEDSAMRSFREFNREVGAYEKAFENCFDLNQAVRITEYSIVHLKHNDTE